MVDDMLPGGDGDVEGGKSSISANGRERGSDLFELLPRPMRLVERKGIVAEAHAWLWGVGESLVKLQVALSTFRRNRHPATAADDVLRWLGWERWTPRLAGEEMASWRMRLRQAFAVHQEGGTNPGVLRVLRLLGHGSAEIYEHFNHVWYYNGQVAYDGSHPYGESNDTWAHFSVVFPGTWVLAGDVVARLRAAVDKVKAAHATLASFRGRVDTFYDGTWAYDGTVMYDGQTVVLWEE